MGRGDIVRSAALLGFILAGTTRAQTPAEATWPAHGGPVKDLAFSPDGSRLASIAEDGKLKLFDVATHGELGSADVSEYGTRVRFTPDGGALLAVEKDDSLAVLDGKTAKPLKHLPLHSVPGGTASFDLSPDGKTIAVVGRGSLRVLSAADGAELKSWEIHTNYGIAAVAFAPDGKTVATASNEHKADVVAWDSGKIPFECPLPLNGLAVAFAPDGKTLFAGDSGGTLMAFDLASGQGKTLLDGRVTIGSLAVTPDGKAVWVGGTGRSPWKVSTIDGKADEQPVETKVWNKAIAVSPDGRRVAGGDNDGAITVWKVGP